MSSLFLKPRVFFGLVVLIIVVPVFARASELIGMGIFPTPGSALAYNALIVNRDKSPQSQVWTNYTGSTIYIYKTKVILLSNTGFWGTMTMEQYANRIVDQGAMIVRTRDQNLLNIQGWDHYGAGANPQDGVMDYGTHPIQLGPGETLTMYLWGGNGYGSNIISVNINAWMWYTLGAP